MKCLGALLLACLLMVCAGAAQAGTLVVLQHQPGDITRPWTWAKIIEQLPAVSAAGYTAILLSPHQHACGGQFSLGYDPEDFRSFDSAHGTQAQLAALIRKAHARRIQVYADMVMNHMCTNNFRYPRFGPGDFHHAGKITDWNDAWQLENGALIGLDDLAQESPYVRGELWNYLVKTNNMGFDGYRWDAAKHVPRWYWRDHVLNNVKRWGKYSFGEVYISDIGILQSYTATGMAVTDYALYFKMRDAFQLNGDMRQLDGAGLAGIDGPNALTFVQNHDVGPPVNKLLAYAFISAYPGYPTFFDVDLRDAVLNNLVWIQNNLAVGPYVNRYKDQNTIVFTRGASLLAGINQSGTATRPRVQTGWRNTELHDYTGHVANRRTDDGGWIDLEIPAQSYVMMAPLR
ncbi:alpha-amylase domain-containing protein [Variovorax rhizosphaerae]|uniref:Alpha-amylase n=1 Tax=Variovorax rhizosphaerae TaxID=1836200 RepID=A0ABU8WPP2_9BURK